MNTSLLTLADLAQLLTTKGLLSDATTLGQDAQDIAVTGADCDSRVVEPHHLFICKGAAFKSAYLVSAREKGACGYLADEAHADGLSSLMPDFPALIATNLREAMAWVAKAAYGNPDEDLATIGITGTKGKSTTTYMLRAILEGNDPYSACGLIGSIETYDGVTSQESVNTTPESPDLWRYLAHMRDRSLRYAVMEVSSQALKYDRVLGLKLDIAGFLNIGEDHISPLEHPNWDDYFQSKLKIFSQATCAVVNLNSDHVDEILERAHACQKLVTFGANRPDADIWAEGIESACGFVTFTCHTPEWAGPITLTMPGTFNVENALCAIACATELHVPYEQIAEGLARTKVPGRMELIQTPNAKVTGIVDFAHNKMAFEKFFPSVVKDFPDHHVIAVFGATGDKATERRFELPTVAGKFADRLIFTKDDPGHEKPEDICRAMVEATPEGVPCEIVPDREAAIARAVELGFAADGPAVICVLGRGTEGVQHECGKLIPAPLDADLFQDAVRDWCAKHPEDAKA